MLWFLALHLSSSYSLTLCCFWLCTQLVCSASIDSRHPCPLCITASLAQSRTYPVAVTHCRSFRLEDGTGPQLYAADVVYAVTALLEAPPALQPGDAAAPDDKADHFW